MGGNPALSGTLKALIFALQLNPLHFRLLNKKNITVVLPSFPIKIRGKSVLGVPEFEIGHPNILAEITT